METVYVIEYDNGAHYESHGNWIRDDYFKTKEGAADYLISKGYYKDGSRFLKFINYRDELWSEGTGYAIIKPCYLRKPDKFEAKEFHIEDYKDLPITLVQRTYKEHVVVIGSTEDVKLEMEEIKLLSESNENKLKELHKIFKCIKNIKKRKSIPDYAKLKFYIELNEEKDKFELLAKVTLKAGESYTINQQRYSSFSLVIRGGYHNNDNSEVYKTYKNLEYRRGHINNNILNNMIEDLSKESAKYLICNSHYEGNLE